jgi:creatinine amidohydrolase/Fe(II)-dependent formamide hydrolase-like protein
MAAKKLAKGAKTEFIRANPDLTAQELVDKAKKHGITLTKHRVHVSRSHDKRSKKVGKPGKKKRAYTKRADNGAAPVRAKKASVDHGTRSIGALLDEMIDGLEEIRRRLSQLSL